MNSAKNLQGCGPQVELLGLELWPAQMVVLEMPLNKQHACVACSSRRCRRCSPASRRHRRSHPAGRRHQIRPAVRRRAAPPPSLCRWWARAACAAEAPLESYDNETKHMLCNGPTSSCECLTGVSRAGAPVQAEACTGLHLSSSHKQLNGSYVDAGLCMPQPEQVPPPARHP